MSLPFETLEKMARDHRESLMKRSFEKANPEAAAAQAAVAALAGVVRSSLTAKQTSDLVTK
jgi:hypothetical protein